MRVRYSLRDLLVAVSLMMVLLSGVTRIFVRTRESATVGRAPTQNYTEARRSTDLLEEDLLACLPFVGGKRFSMDDSAGGLKHAASADRLTFVATTTVGSTRQTGKVVYFLLPAADNRAGGAVTK